MDYKTTLNLLRTDFPMRANLPEREPEILRRWDELDIYKLVREHRAGAPRWVLHDGPPYANGNIHLGQALNKILKDISIKYKTMRGFDCPYVPGWDTQGIPTEQGVEREFGLDRHTMPPLEWRGRCRDLALKYVNTQREQFRRLGVRGDWYNPYLTLAPEYQSRQVRAFGAIAERGLIYRGLRPVYWCYHCETALADDEIEYHDRTSPAIYVAFRLKSLPDDFADLPADAEVHVIIWTTTPWTLPGNTAIALNPSATYVLARHDGRYYLMARALAETTMRDCGLTPYEVVAEAPGRDFEGLEATHPLYGRPSKLVLADYVTMDTGTGCVHTAPGHGLEDYTTALRYGLEVLSPVDDQGHFTPEAGPDLAGQVCDQANSRVVELLGGALLNEGTIEHSYPHCWRCDNPVIYRSTYQWFMDIDKVRDAALDEIRKARWIPSWGQARIAGMVESRPDWCISRQRVWGVPIPAFFCDDCGEVLVDRKVIDHVADLIAADEKGADVWWRLDAADLIPAGVTCSCGSSTFRKETDIMSVWFDSGCSHYAVLRSNPDLACPADLYLEGDDQYQCWFQTSLWVAVAMAESAPFKMVVGHGFFVDETGQKLSKSKGNIIDPADIYNQYGADVLRMWFTYADFRSKMFLTESILQQVADAYRRLRNTARFMLANLQDFDPAKDALPYEDLSDLDKWALMRMQQVIERMTRAFDAWDLHLFHHELHAFVATDLSAFYLDVLKDTLYTELPGSQLRRSAQTALWSLLVDLVRMMAPIMTFTSDEIWEYLRRLDPTLPVSVQLEDWPAQRPEWLDAGLQERFAALLRVRDKAMEALEHAKAEDVLTKPLEARLEISVAPQLAGVLEGFGLEELKRLFIVSEVVLLGPDDVEEAAGADGIVVRASLSEGGKCRRCWVRDPSVGESSDYPDLCDRCLDRVTRWPS